MKFVEDDTGQSEQREFLKEDPEDEWEALKWQKQEKRSENREVKKSKRPNLIILVMFVGFKALFFTVSIPSSLVWSVL